MEVSLFLGHSFSAELGFPGGAMFRVGCVAVLVELVPWRWLVLGHGDARSRRLCVLGFWRPVDEQIGYRGLVLV